MKDLKNNQINDSSSNDNKSNDNESASNNGLYNNGRSQICLQDFTPLDVVQQRLLIEFNKINFPAGYSKNSYKVFFHVLEHFIRYTQDSENIKFIKLMIF